MANLNTQQLTALIEKSVLAILEERSVASPPHPLTHSPTQMVLVAVCCGECLRPEVVEQLEALRRAGFLLVEPGAHELKDRATRERLVAKSAVVLMPSVGDDDAAKMALGIFDEPTARVALSALAIGKPLLAAPHSPYEDALKSRAPLLARLWKSQRVTLESFGFQFVPPGAIAEAVQKLCAPKSDGKTPSKPGKPAVITAREIEAAARQGGDWKPPAGAVITPLARDRAKELGVTL